MNIDAFRQSCLLPGDSGCNLPGSLSLVWNRQDHASGGFFSGNRCRWPQLLAPGQRGLEQAPGQALERAAQRCPHPCPSGRVCKPFFYSQPAT